MAYDKNLDRIYSDRTYLSTTMVRHAGTTDAAGHHVDLRVPPVDRGDDGDAVFQLKGGGRVR